MSPVICKSRGGTFVLLLLLLLYTYTFVRGRMCRAHIYIYMYVLIIARDLTPRTSIPPVIAYIHTHTHTHRPLVIVKGVDLRLHTNAFF